ncbi:DUF397 domain-containing protein [Streptomyces sp. NPDC005931]|uniref:DUF397 domain-containing protein n=1 Tax=Streptomyces sp. NPDC005931 TaxID=3364737 RepID=UPI0036BC42E0
MSHSSDIAWIKSSYSDSSNPNDCVEVALSPTTVQIRDSKVPHGPRLAVAPGTWTDFLAHAAAR